MDRAQSTHHGISSDAGPLRTRQRQRGAPGQVGIFDHQLAGGDAGCVDRGGVHGAGIASRSGDELGLDRVMVKHEHDRDHRVAEVFQRIQRQPIIT